MEARILVVDDDEDLLTIVADAMEKFGHHTDSASSFQQALTLLGNHSYDILITDKNMPDAEGNQEGGMTLLKQVKQAQPEVEVIIMTGYASIETALEAMKTGAFDYLMKPFSLHELKEKIERVMNYKSFISSEFNLRLYKNIHQELLNLLENRSNQPEAKIKAMLKSLGSRIDHLFGSQKEWETIVALQREALEAIEVYAAELKQMLPPDNPAQELIDKIHQESQRRV